MNFIFQFGEFDSSSSFWADLFVAIVGAFIGTGGAIWLYYRQTRDQRQKEENTKVEIQKDKLHYLSYLLNDISPNIRLFSEAAFKFHNEIIEYPTYLPELGVISIYNLDRIVNKISQEDYYHAYVTLISDKNISEIFSLVD